MNIADLKTGDTLIADDGFSCIDPEQICVVHEDATGKFIRCADGKHYLDGQCDANGNVVGLYRPK